MGSIKVAHLCMAFAKCICMCICECVLSVCKCVNVCFTCVSMHVGVSVSIHGCMCVRLCVGGM